MIGEHMRRTATCRRTTVLTLPLSDRDHRSSLLEIFRLKAPTVGQTRLATFRGQPVMSHVPTLQATSPQKSGGRSVV
ncbi:hypothetical protein OF83DRAFT_1092941 [Amylostereum chailletii]|nr:hypothetical protein OF83DRAFT_1092941 [Amylostereum chailletii]